jgi:DNA-binding beta-propeller fold protein YncE
VFFHKGYYLCGIVNKYKNNNMKKLNLMMAIVICLAVTQRVNAQHQLVKLWETDSVFKVPESVCYDAKNEVMYVSNVDGNDPWIKDGKGSIGKISKDGKVIAAEWITGLQAPKGMGLYKNKLYVADLDEIVVINVKKGAIDTRIPVAGATGLNDVTIDKSGVVYVSDMKQKKVFKITGTSVELIAENLKNPNGVLKTKKALYLLDDGTLNKLNDDKTLKQLATGMEGGTDGVVKLKNGDFIVSCWAGVVYYVSAKKGDKQILLDGRSKQMNSADIGFNANEQVIFVPTFFKNTVAAYKFMW